MRQRDLRTEMSTRGNRRGRPRWALLVLAACLVAVSAAAMSRADDVVPDGDIVTAGDQALVNLGTVAPGAVLTPKTSFRLICDSKNHVDQGQTVTMTYSGSSSVIPAGSMTATNASIGPIPASWPDDTSGGGSTNCTNPLPTQGDNGDATVTITAPTSPGTYTFSPRWTFSLSPAGAGDSNAVQGSGATVGYTLTVAVPNTAPTTPGTPTLAAGSTTPNNGVFSLTWSASTDAQGDPITYTLQHKDANDVAYSTVASGITSNSYAFPPESREGDGTWAYRLNASDGTLTSGFSGDSAAVKSDRSGPNAPNVATTPASPAFTDGGGNTWWKDTVTVTFTANGDAALADGSVGSGVDVSTLTGPSTHGATGTFTDSGTIKDNVGNASSATSLTTRVDADVPLVSFADCPTGKVLAGSSGSVHYSASDSGSGLADPASGSIALDTSTSGAGAASVTVHDHVGHSASASCAYTVDAPPSTPGKPSGASPNRGSFTLSWAASTDPEGDPIGYTLQHRPVGGSWSTVASGISGASYTFGGSNPAEDEGTWQYQVKAGDGSFDSDYSDSSDAIKADKSKPNAPLVSTLPASPDYAGDGGWFKDTVTVHFAANGDPALADGSDGSGVDPATVPANATYTSLGSHTASGTVKDFAGNESDANGTTVQVDDSNPVVSFADCPTAPVLVGSSTTVTWNAADTGSHLATAASGTLTLDTTAPGPHTVTSPTASDHVGHTTSGVSCTYSIARATFEAPIDGGNVMNIAKAGRVVPVKTHVYLNGAEKTGANTAAGAVTIGAASTTCTATQPTDDIEAYAAGSSNTGTQFRWDTSSLFWIYNLDTSSFGMATNSCYQVSIYLNGTKAGYFFIRITK
jgi:hypothetical protein